MTHVIKWSKGCSEKTTQECIDVIKAYIEENPGYEYTSINIEHLYKGLWHLDDNNNLIKTYCAAIDFNEYESTTSDT